MELLPGLHHRHELIAAGHDPGALRRPCRAGSLEVVRRGTYGTNPHPVQATNRQLTSDQ